jgi:hypothetical protein
MNAKPGIDGLLEGVIVGLANEIMPFLTSEKAMATATMMQSILQGVRQTVPTYLSGFAEEHNGMTESLRNAAAALEGVVGPEADRVRERAKTLGSLPDLPLPVAFDTTVSAHTELSRALEASIGDLDIVQRAGGPDAGAADQSLNAIRAHLAPRYLRDHATITIAGGFIGRG